MKSLFYACLIGTASLTYASDSYAQNTVVSLKVQNQTVEEVLNQIEAKTDFTFFYNTRHVDLNRRVSIAMNEKNIFKILDAVFADSDVAYQVVDKKIVLSKKDIMSSTATQQNNTIKGTVVDPNGEPVIGANVVVKGTTTGTITDMDGNFSLEAPQGSTLVVSYIGFSDYTIKITNQKSLAITLKEDVEALDEVVVVGYGTQNKQAITGSVVKADLETLKAVPTNNVLETVKGSIPGLNVGGTNKAGQVAGMSVRGQNSTSGNSPLIVVDGAIYDGSLADIAPDDIENFTVLKDASAAAVYGSRSANGVILIQTKRGRTNGSKPDFNVNLSYGITNQMKKVKLYDAEGYIQKLIDLRAYQGLTTDIENIPLYLQAEESKNYNATPDHRPSIPDPFEPFTQTAYNMKANLSISNNSDLANYYISASLTDQKGIMKNDRYKNFSGRMNVESHLTDWLTIGIKANYSIRDLSGESPQYYDCVNISPYGSLYNEDGSLIHYPQNTSSVINPLWRPATDDLEKYNMLGAVLNGKISVPWVKGLSYEIVYSNNLCWNQRNYFYDENTYKGEMAGIRGERKNANNYHMLLDNMIKYNNTFNQKHNIDVTLLYSREHRTWDSMRSYAEGFDNTVLSDNKLEDGKKQLVDTGAGESGAIGMMARATYTFDNRYSITGTVRRDGCSAFSKNKKWATFASGGVNWNISNEAFMQDVDFVDNLALRLSYGSNGNQSISPYSTLAKVGTGKYYYAGDPSYTITQRITSFALNDLGWEKTTGFNGGLDFSVLNNRLSGSIDAYATKTTDLLFNLALPSISGKSSMLSNIGEIKNRGFEIALHSVNITNNEFTWSSDFAFSLNRNKVVSILGDDKDGDGKEDDLISSGYFIGKTLGTIYSYKQGRLYQQSDVDNGTILNGMRPGDISVEDVNGDGKIDSQHDRQFLGTSKENFRWSLTNTFDYKGFSLMVYINSIWGGNGYYLANNSPYLGAYTERIESNRPKYDYWTPQNTDAKYPRLDYIQKAHYKTSRFQDRSFIKLQKVALTYDFSRFVKKIGMNNLRLSLSGDNLLTFAPHWDGLDPEVGTTLEGFPSLRTYQMTLMFNF